MSITLSESLLQQYNKYNKKQETPIIYTDRDDSSKLATWSYANMYDALYDKYSKNKNFNINMWRDAINAGEQDQYFAFLEANKDNTLSDMFYDPAYYNYEQMMLEMYLPFANNTDKEERFDDVYDKTTGKWVQQSIGEMSEYEYVKHQLDIAKNIRSAEINEQYEQISKDRMEWYEKLGTGFIASVSEFGEGVAQSLAGLADTIIGIVYATGTAFGGQDWGDAFVEYFGEKGLLANEQATLRAWLNDYERKYTDFRNLDGSITGWGKYLGNVLNSIGNMTPAIVIGILTGGASVAASTTALGSTMLGSSAAGIGAAAATGGAAVGSKVFYASIFANNMYENANNPKWHGQPAYKVITNAGVKAAAEYYVEKVLGKVLGSTIQNSMLGIGGNGNSLKDLTKAFTKTAGAKYVLKSGGQEALEEILQDSSTFVVDKFTELWAEGYDADGLDFQALTDAGITGFISSIFLSGASVIGNSIRDKKSGGFYIDTKDGPKQIKGLNRIYFGAVMQDFHSAIDQLKNTGFSAEKNLRLAKDVFGAVTVLSDFYSTFDKQRLKNCELLLDRISKAESQREAALEAGIDLETYNEYSEFDKKVAAKFAKDTDTYSQIRTIDFASALEASFNEMVFGAKARAIKYFADKGLDQDKKPPKEKQKKTSAKLKRITTEREKELKDAGVTDITSASNDGTVYTKDPLIKSIEEKIGAKAASRYEELCKDYEWVFTTDGHIALEDVDKDGNKILFVSENWLKNYETSEIYRFIVQTNLIKMLETIPSVSSMFEDVTKYYRKLSKNADATKNEAIIQFLFNESVYQDFLLSQDGKNLHKYKKFIFRLHTLIKGFTTQSGYLVHAGKPSPKRQNLLNQVYDKIKEAWRKPTLKAILNWNMTPQDIGADNILTDADLEFVDQYGKHKQSLLGPKAGASKSAYQNLKEDIIAHAPRKFNDVELELIERGTRDDASPRDALSAFALLDYADDRMPMTSGDLQVLAPLRELVDETNDVLLNHKLPSLEVEKLIEDMNWYVDEAIANAPGWMDSRNLNTEKGIVERTADDIRETVFGTDYGDMLIFDVNNLDLDDFDMFDDATTEIIELIQGLDNADTLAQLKIDVNELADKLRTNAPRIFDSDKIGKYDRDMVFDTLYDYLYNTFDKIYELIDGGHTFKVYQSHRDRLDNLRDVFYAADGQGKLTNAMMLNTTTSLLKILQEINDVNMERGYQSRDLQHSFVIPPEALGDESSMKPALIQHKADKLEEFRQIYGIEAQQLLYGDLSGLSLEQRNKIDSEMQSLGITKYSTFVCRQLEAMLGPDWAVSEIYGTMYEQEARILSDARATLQLYILRLHDLYYLQIASPIPKASKEIRDIANNILKIYDESKSFFDRLDANADQVVENETYEVKTTYGKALKNFRRLLTNINEALSHTGNESRLLLDIVGSESAIYEFMAVLSREQTKMESPIVGGFDIVRKVKARQLLSSKLFADTREQQDKNIVNMFIGDVTPWEYFSFYANKKDGEFIDPTTGEFFQGREADILNATFMLKHPRVLSATDFLKSKIDALDGVSVKIELRSSSKLGEYSLSTRCITLYVDIDYQGNLRTNTDLLDTLCHELNHAIQHYYGLPGGGGVSLTIRNKGLLEHVLNEYWEYVAYTARGDLDIRDIIYDAKIKENRTLKLSDFPTGTSIKTDLAYCAYRLLQGELWAQYYSHNGRPVAGYKPILLNNKEGFISPDGTTFLERDKSTLLGDNIEAKVQSGTAKSVDMSFSSKRNLFVGTMRNILTARADAYARGPRGTKFMHNKLHTSLNIAGKSTEICDDLLSPDVSTVERVINSLYQIDTIITNPRFLNKEIKKHLNGDFSEGNVYYRIKEYIEEKYPGISIDRTQSHKYIFVSTNSFDDIIKPSLASKLDSKDFTLFNKYAERTVTLSEFYKISELNKLGLIDVPVVFSSKVKTQAVRNSKYPNGAIFVETGTNFMTDEAFLDKLNHELRHLLQMYNKYELGFTRDIKVTREMIADVKAHIPELFEDEILVENAKSFSKNNWEAEIVKSFIYYTTHGEMEAYGFIASILAAKPTYVQEEAGTPTIFMPWYNAKTGEGRYRTEYIAARAENAETVKLTVEQRAAQKKAKPEVKGGRINVSRKAAEGTNLEFFTKKLGAGEQLQMDVGLYDFIVATTDNLDKLPPELAEAIKKGILNKDALFRWFRKGRENVDKLFDKPTKSDPRYDEKLAKFVKDVEMYNKQYDYAFKLMNKYIFKNDYLTSENELSEFVNKDISQIWAAIRVARKHKLSEEALETEFAKHGSSGKKIQMLIDAMQTGDYAKDFKTQLEKWDIQRVDRKNGKGRASEKLEYNEILPFVRTTAMLNFNGTLASAYAIGDIIRREGKIYYEKEGTLSYNATMSDKEGNAAEYGDNLSDANKTQEIETDNLGNDILAIYLRTHKELTQDEMIDRLVPKYLEHLIDKTISQKFEHVKNKKAVKELLSMTPYDFSKRFTTLENKENLTDKELSRYKQLKIIKPHFEQIYLTLKDWAENLRNSSLEKVSAYYDKIITREANSVPQTDNTFKVPDEYDMYTEKFKTLPSIRKAIRYRGKIIADWVTEKKLSLDDLPDDIKDMFEYKVFEGKRKKQYKVFTLKEGVYEVGPGKVALNKKMDGKGLFFIPEYDIEKDTGKLRHDTTEIMRNLVKIDKFYQAQREIFKEQKLSKEQEERDLQRQLIKYRRDAEKKQNEIDIAVKRAVAQSNKKGDLKQTEITVKKRRNKLSDTPNYFTIVAGKEMPQKLYKIFDTSFTEMRNTAVQFVSKDENGEYYDKSKEKNFDSLVKHEVANWDDFYEANRAELLELTREDVLDFLEFFQSGVVTLDGPGNKLEAFKVFMVGYIVDGARRNFNNWNFSDKEIATLEKLYESIASKAGSTLRAVRSMIKVVDPLKKVRQYIFDDWMGVSDADKDDLFKAIDAMQTEKDKKERDKKTQAVINLAEKLSKQQEDYLDKHKVKRFSKEWWSRFYDKTKSFRYTSMLSSPMTWIRNQISNVGLTTVNSVADVVSNIVFAPLGKKAYRKDQWDITNTKIRDDVAAFIKDNFLDNPLFDKKTGLDLYNMSNKYDNKARYNVKGNKNVFVDIIVKAYERKFAANHRFDTAALNWWSKFVDARLSDQKFIKFAAGRYFGKILTIEFEKGNVKLEMNDDVLNLFAEAVIQANRDYMHKRNAVTDMIDGIRDAWPPLHEFITLWQPFLNSSLNWYIDQVYRLSPFGLIGAIRRMCKLEEQITKADELRAKGRLTSDSRFTEYLIRRDIGKGLLGTLFTTFAIIMILTGLIKIEEEDDKFFIRAGENVRVDISSLYGSSTFLIGASIAQSVLDGEKNIYDTLGTASIQMANGFFLNDILERHKWNSNPMESVVYELDSFARSFVPQFWQLLINMTNNKKIKYSSGFKGSWERWLNSWVPLQPAGEIRVDPYTGKARTKYALPVVGPILDKGLAFGTKIFWYDVSEQEKLALEYGIKKGELTGELTVDGKKVNLDRIQLNQVYGMLNEKSLTKIKSQSHKVEMPDGKYKTLAWDKLSTEQRARVIDRTMNTNAEIAKIYVWTQKLGHKYYASASMLKLLRQAGFTKNVYLGDKGFVE